MSSVEQSAPPTVPQPAPEPADWKGALASLGLGLAGALVGLLPWIITGMRLPLQNLWALPTLPDDMPVAWLPFSQYTVSFVISIMVVGAAAAGIAACALRARLPRRAPLSIAAGVLFVQVVATAQAANVVGSGVGASREGSVYLAACIGVAVVGIVCGLVVLGLISRGPRAGATVALAFASITVTWWVGGFFPPVGIVPVTVDYGWALDILRWLSPLLVGASIAWGGIRTAGRIVAAGVSLLMLWVVPPLATAVTAAVGSRVMLRYPLELLDYGWGVFTMALLMPALVVPPLVVAVVTAAAGIVGRELLERRGR